MSENKKEGLRFNEGKLRFDLVHPIGLEGMVKVLTAGSLKYAARNWERGLKWTSVIASLKRHLAAVEKGEDYDKETKLLHVDHIQCNAHFLSAYYKIAPQFDDRQHTYLKPLKIGLDVDEVLANWIGAWTKKWDLNVPQSWFFQRDIAEKFETMRKNGEIDEFYLNLEPLIKPEDIPFEPHCYITSRPVDKKITEQWLDKHEFPARPVFTVGSNQSKIEVAKESGIDVFVDDRMQNFVELNNAGIFCYLYDTPHNRRYDVGFRRIYSLKELI